MQNFCDYQYPALAAQYYRKGYQMKSYRWIILGAGPSGLSFAHALRDCGETSFLVVEKERVAGGLCRSADVDGSPIDIRADTFWI